MQGMRARGLPQQAMSVELNKPGFKTVKDGKCSQTQVLRVTARIGKHSLASAPDIDGWQRPLDSPCVY